ncbi:PAS domain S-box protein [Microcoleus vaginatus]|uniref:PAS domain S-box protein n=1 Tax=Microcoleus vaginatus TaxID=119532 RepID=UPI00403F0173
MQSQLGKAKRDRSRRQLLELCPIGLALCRTDGTFLDVNPAFASIIGRTVAETLHLNYWEIQQTQCAGREKYLESQAKNSCTGPCEAAYKHKNNHLVPVRVSERAIETGGERAIWLSAEEIFNPGPENSDPLESAPPHSNSHLEKLLTKQTAETGKNSETTRRKNRRTGADSRKAASRKSNYRPNSRSDDFYRYERLDHHLESSLPKVIRL